MTRSTMRLEDPWLSRWHWTACRDIWARHRNLLPGPGGTFYMSLWHVKMARGMGAQLGLEEGVTVGVWEGGGEEGLGLHGRQGDPPEIPEGWSVKEAVA